MFSPEPQYNVEFTRINVRDFWEYPEDYVVRPPYQRKNVWSRSKQQALLDSLVRRYYIPRIVLREVRLGDSHMRREVIDGQQRIRTVQAFFDNELPLPDTLEDVHEELAGTYYHELAVDLRKYIDKELVYDADLIHGIAHPQNVDHQQIASSIFYRLQQGESLNFMEIAHSRLSSLARNFIVKFSDDIRFDYDAYEPIDGNDDKHPFFSLLNRNNNRMQHLAVLTRLLMFEFDDGPTNIRETQVAEFIDEHQTEEGIGSYSFEDTPEAKAVLSCLDDFYQIFKADPMIQEGASLQELKREYFILSFVLLLRHLRKHYVLRDEHREAFREFLYDFHERWDDRNNEEPEILLFSDNRQQDKGSIEIRDRVLRELYFRQLDEEGIEIKDKDAKRTFSEAERIRIYRRDRGLCQQCVEEGRPAKEAEVPWEEYEADHVLPHAKGGRTVLENAQVLCSYHNKVKGAATESV